MESGTKALLVAIAEVVRKSDSLKDAYDSMIIIASAEGVSLKPWYDKKQNCEKDKK